MRIKKIFVMFGLAAALALVGAACGAGDADRDDTGAITEADDVNPNSLQVGDCYNDPAAGETQVTELEAVPCEEAHDNEVFHVFDLEGDEFPGQDEVRAEALAGCEPEAEAYVGAPAADAGLRIAPVSPTEQSWNDRDDRTVLCAIYAEDGTELTGSLQGAAEGAGGGGDDAGTEDGTEAEDGTETDDTETTEG